MIEEFIKEIDSGWKMPVLKTINIQMIGSAALFLQCDYARGTKDADIFRLIHEIEIDGTSHDVNKELENIAGKNSRLQKKYNMYIDIVSPGLPFLPPRPSFHECDRLNKQLKNFRIEAMDVNDVVVSKIGRFIQNDRDDIFAIAKMNLIDHKTLLSRFKLACESWLLGSRAARLPKIISNLNTVERDMLLAPESHIELPDYHLE